MISFFYVNFQIESTYPNFDEIGVGAFDRLVEKKKTVVDNLSRKSCKREDVLSVGQGECCWARPILTGESGHKSDVNSDIKQAFVFRER